MTLRFTPPHDQEPGIVADLLKQSYAELVSSDPQHWSAELPKWEEFDRDVFQHPDTVGACVFLSWSDHQLVGFGSYDIRERPEFGVIGHNCILPEFRGKGFGKQQILEILRRFEEMGMKTAKTWTLANSFFVPAQRMYTACGFREMGRHPWDRDPSQEVIQYEKRIG